jgi:hypothetical protein
MKRLCALGLVSLLFAACGANEKKDGTTVASRPAWCPEPGTKVPLAQLAAQADKFKRCEVTTEATLLGPYTISGIGLPDCGKKGASLFQLGIPGGQGQSALVPTAIASVEDSVAQPLFSAPGNALVTLRGEMVHKSGMMGVDLGGMGRCFKATAASVQSTASK